MPDLTAQVADFITGVTLDSITPSVIDEGITHSIDYFVVATAGSVHSSSRTLRKTLGHAFGASTIIGTVTSSTAETAALYNGFAAHALDYDDTQLSTSAQAVYGLLTDPTSPVLSAELAIGEEVHAGGAEVLLSYLTGLEVACRLADAIDSKHYQHGFHTSGTVGAFEAAAAVAKLLQLDTLDVQTTLGVVGSLATGLRKNFGTMTKPLHVG